APGEQACSCTAWPCSSRDRRQTRSKPRSSASCSVAAWSRGCQAEPRYHLTMLLHAVRRSDRRVLSVSPILLGFAALPGAGLLLLPLLALVPTSGGGVLWFMLAFCSFFFGVATYAFGKAAWAKQVS